MKKPQNSKRPTGNPTAARGLEKDIIALKGRIAELEMERDRAWRETAGQYKTIRSLTTALTMMGELENTRNDDAEFVKRRKDEADFSDKLRKHPNEIPF